ncbi:MAG TPA: hypothetical protein VH092_24435 [Urbifossiella sp.]|jgi:hypothetical protein|nr:hypothetical protein [Urbifossiella sp.]
MSKLVVPPVLRLAVLCQSIKADREDRPFALEVPIHTLRWPNGHRRRTPPAGGSWPRTRSRRTPAPRWSQGRRNG